jgi:hypothetical protein
MGFDETNEGAAYLSALKNSGSPRAAGAATAPATAHSVEARPEQISLSLPPSAAREEKRQTPRYRCKGSARMLESGSTIATWATFADISMSGCYVEAATPLRLGTVLTLTLEINGFRVEATGEVRVAYPNLGMGIRFIKISEEDRERLRKLVDSISQPSGSRSSDSQFSGSQLSGSDLSSIGSPLASHVLSVPQLDPLPSVANPGATLQALLNFFENRHVMGREEFLTILRNNQ